MNVNLVLFIPGAGGNFLSRILTLDSKTVPLGKQGEYQQLDTDQRFEQYTYRNYPPLPIAQNDLVTWWKFELENAYPFRRLGIEKLVELDLEVIEFSHPEYFDHLLTVVGPNDCVKYFYIDTTGAEDWVVKQKIQKTGANGYSLEHVYDEVTQETKVINNQKTLYDFNPIYLEEIVAGGERFLQEYQRVCRLMGIDHHDDYAQQLYWQWVKTWG